MADMTRAGKTATFPWNMIKISLHRSKISLQFPNISYVFLCFIPSKWQNCPGTWFPSSLLFPGMKISVNSGILTPRIAGGLPDFSTWESAGLPCFTPICTSIYGTDAHRFWRTPIFINMEIRQMPRCPCFFP